MLCKRFETKCFAIATILLLLKPTTTIIEWISNYITEENTEINKINYNKDTVMQ